MAGRGGGHGRDVDFTYRYMVDPKTPTAYGEPFRQIRQAEVVDPYTYRVTYEKPYAPALLSWGIWILPRHILEPAWKAGVDLRTTRQNRFPIGSGPYRVQASGRQGRRSSWRRTTTTWRAGRTSTGSSTGSSPTSPRSSWS